MMLWQRYKRIGAATLTAALTFGLIFTYLDIEALAAEAAVTFGSPEYGNVSGAVFPMEIIIDAPETEVEVPAEEEDEEPTVVTEKGIIGSCTLEIEYDSSRLEYLGGGTSSPEEGKIEIKAEDTGAGTLHYFLKFKAISGGGAMVQVMSAEITDEDGAAYEVNNLPFTSVTLDGEDTARLAAEKERQEAEEREKRISGEEEEEAPVEEEEEKPKQTVFFNPVVFIVIMALLIFFIADILVILYVKNVRNKRKAIRKKVYSPTAMQLPDMPDGPVVRDMDEEQALQEELGEPVISIEDVTMQFKLYKTQPSGLKDFLIQTIKREVTYRRLFALYHVSFNVYKGEVVGVIGTNGSGKSTLLKIVSGALKPTEGEVYVDRDKVQLLTLGTGFDPELTARENVFLNGAIIGYSREFMEQHYDEIVEFAELQDFMDEKMKNFSSGMVSRLGFAIATAGDAAEILILDEVLSVGDAHFQKKSLARVKEMIHGGSTVLIVSHSMDTILDNCTKAVWIEKGVMRMMGEPRAVCAAYKQLSA